MEQGFGCLLAAKRGTIQGLLGHLSSSGGTHAGQLFTLLRLLDLAWLVSTRLVVVDYKSAVGLCGAFSLLLLIVENRSGYIITSPIVYGSLTELIVRSLLMKSIT